MKILFICGDLEPGAGGVGDHCYILAHACRERGHQTALAALADRHLSRTEDRRVPGQIPVLRTPNPLPASERLRVFKDFLASFQPDWISLHWVPHAYHPKGIPLAFLKGLLRQIGDLPLQVYFHELWARPNPTRPQTLLYTALQKHLITRLLRTPNLRHSHTSNAVWAERLRKRGTQPELLPLFGNFPLHTQPDPQWWENHGYPADPLALRVGLFGTLYPDHDPEPVLAQIHASARKEGRRLQLYHAGNATSPALQNLRAVLRNIDPATAFESFGRVDAQETGSFLLGLDAFVTTVGADLLPKSSNAITALEHGLPVILCDPAPPPRSDYPFPEDRQNQVLSLSDGPHALEPSRLQSVRNTPAPFLDPYLDSFLQALAP